MMPSGPPSLVVLNHSSVSSPRPTSSATSPITTTTNHGHPSAVSPAAASPSNPLCLPETATTTTTLMTSSSKLDTNPSTSTRPHPGAAVDGRSRSSSLSSSEAVEEDLLFGTRPGSFVAVTEALPCRTTEAHTTPPTLPTSTSLSVTAADAVESNESTELARPQGCVLREEKDLMKTAVLSSIQSKRFVRSQRGYLFPGASFQGEQRSGRQSYSISVQIQDVDWEMSTACGYLSIKGLTDEFPDLTTCFEAEIIGSRFSFLTRKWEATEQIDQQHWTKFAAFRPFESVFNQPNFHYDPLGQRHVFMRWKELFLVPDHRIRTVNGASFAGFYYVCLDGRTGTLSGFYYHQNSELFQNILMRPVEQRAGRASFEYR